MSRCEQQAGLLSPRPCENAAVGACARCGRGVCEAHASMAEAGLVCTTCALGFGVDDESLDHLAAGGTLTALFSDADVAAFDAAAEADEPDDMMADLS